MKRESEEVRRWYQFPQPQPSPAPPPQPQMPQYGPTAASGEHQILAAYLKQHPGRTGVVLVGAILLLIPATRALIVGTVGATLLVTSTTASAAPNQKEKETK
jgi:hypothetical protein